MSFRAEIKKPFREQVDFFLAKLNIPVAEWLDLDAQYNDLAFYVTGAMQADLIADLRAAVDEAIAEGRTLAWFREQFDRIVADHGWGATNPKLDDPGYRDWRARIIYTTNLQSSFAAGRWAQLTDPEVMAYADTWVYKHSDLVAHPRPWHLARNNHAAPAGSEIWRTRWVIPGGFGCRCYWIAMPRAAAEAAGYVFAPIPGDDQTYRYTNRASGEVLTLPVGVDPGFQFSAGSTVRERAAEIAAGKRPAWPPDIAAAFDRVMAARERKA